MGPNFFPLLSIVVPIGLYLLQLTFVFIILPLTMSSDTTSTFTEAELKRFHAEVFRNTPLLRSLSRVCFIAKYLNEVLIFSRHNSNKTVNNSFESSPFIRT